jgi:hypothetical protein
VLCPFCASQIFMPDREIRLNVSPDMLCAHFTSHSLKI